MNDTEPSETSHIFQKMGRQKKGNVYAISRKNHFSWFKKKKEKKIGCLQCKE